MSEQRSLLAKEPDLMHLHPLTSVLKKNRRRGRGWTQALGPEQLLRACEAITAGKGMYVPWRGLWKALGAAEGFTSQYPSVTCV